MVEFDPLCFIKSFFELTEPPSRALDKNNKKRANEEASKIRGKFEESSRSTGMCITYERDLLWYLEGVLVEMLLEHFVSEVDAELLERVVLENLEPENVQATNTFGLVFDAT